HAAVEGDGDDDLVAWQHGRAPALAVVPTVAAQGVLAVLSPEDKGCLGAVTAVPLISLLVIGLREGRG
ncbi:MAG TPA: hypothetical protein VMH83_14405, partial [Candidatus Acidoferrum sp.]|nr:hypothetical protein [Candidatus Acidoferrum sp.]